MNQSFSWELFEKMPIVGIMRNLPIASMDNIAKQYIQAGLTNLEVTMNSEGAESTIALLVEKYGLQLNIGAGTVCTLHDLDRALSAGARFIVTPVLTEEVIEGCVARKIPVFPGAYTPTEIYKAWHLGASMVKVFPSSGLGAAYIKEVLAPLNYISLLPTGGITLENCTDFLQAGARGIGLGGQLFPKELIINQDWVRLREIFEQFSHRISHFLKENTR